MVYENYIQIQYLLDELSSVVKEQTETNTVDAKSLIRYCLTGQFDCKKLIATCIYNKKQKFNSFDNRPNFNGDCDSIKRYFNSFLYEVYNNGQSEYGVFKSIQRNDSRKKGMKENPKFFVDCYNIPLLLAFFIYYDGRDFTERPWKSKLKKLNPLRQKSEDSYIIMQDRILEAFKLKSDEQSMKSLLINLSNEKNINRDCDVVNDLVYRYQIDMRFHVFSICRIVDYYEKYTSTEYVERIAKMYLVSDLHIIHNWITEVIFNKEIIKKYLNSSLMDPFYIFDNCFNIEFNGMITQALSESGEGVATLWRNPEYSVDDILDKTRDIFIERISIINSNAIENLYKYERIYSDSSFDELKGINVLGIVRAPKADKSNTNGGFFIRQIQYTKNEDEETKSIEEAISRPSIYLYKHEEKIANENKARRMIAYNILGFNDIYSEFFLREDVEEKLRVFFSKIMSFEFFKDNILKI